MFVFHAGFYGLLVSLLGTIIASLTNFTKSQR